MKEIGAYKEMNNEKERGLWRGLSGCDTQQ